MESYSIRNLTFYYPEQERRVLDDISLEIKQGQFVILCGPSGCGKTTLLRQLKTALIPNGVRGGSIYFEGENLKDLGQQEQASRIGFVMQNPENQIVTDKVWHELAFGLESLGYDTPTIRLRVAEMASFFGIQNWFYKDVTELSGGQKQLLNLAAIMAMQPSVLILDEPTSYLDPIAASDFLEILGKINRELGITVILTEHRLEEAMDLADRTIVMDNGRIIADGSPKSVGERIRNQGHRMFLAMPAPMRIYAGVKNDLECPITVREGREWLNDYVRDNPVQSIYEYGDVDIKREQTTVEANEIWFKYEKELPDVIKGASFKVYKGELFAILGGNGTGKSTILSLISGINRPYRGNININGKELSTINHSERYNGLIGVLPQNPQSMFVKKTVQLDLYEILKGKDLSQEEKRKAIKRVAYLCKLNELLDRHPYDLSGGEQQRAALAKVLLLKPKILLLDEPTKGMDGEFKQLFGIILKRLLKQGATIIMVSHDIEFCAKYAHRCALFFDGGIVTDGRPREFFSGNNFYTTSANRLARHLLPEAIIVEDVIRACNGKVPLEEEDDFDKYEQMFMEKRKEEKDTDNTKITEIRDDTSEAKVQIEKEKRHLSKRTMIEIMLILFLIPLTIFFGTYYLGDRKYYFISLLIILETMLPFVMIFEKRRPQARELVIIAVLCGIGVAGRAAFFMLPQFKPVAAIVIVTGVAFGGESGFLVGAMTMFLSNIMYGQGPITPWQMFAMGIIGFLAGILFRKGLLKRDKISLAVFGGLAVFFIYGGIMNPASVLMFQTHISWAMILTSWITGIPFDLVHGAATVFFILVIGEPMLEKLDRIKVKYGLVEGV